MKPFLNQVITLTIQRLGIHGEGVASVEGFTVFVDGALPGEEVEASIYEVRKNYARAKVCSFLHTSPHRTNPLCPVFGRCGGCQIMHLDYAQQLETKRQRVVDALQRIGKVQTDVRCCVPSPLPFAYRNKIQLPCHDSRLGLYAFGSHDLVEIEKCYIHCPLGEKVFHEIKKVVKKSSPQALRYVLIKTAVQTNQVLVILVTGSECDMIGVAQEIKNAMPEVKGVVQNINPAQGNVILGKTFRTLAGDGYIFDTICHMSFKVSPASFFQVNPGQAENLYRRAVEWCELNGTENVLDAYCGVGTLSLLLAQRAKKVYGVESVADAISDAKENARANGIKNAVFTCALAEEYIGQLSDIEVAVLNPPRGGCNPSFLAQLIKLAPKRVVYISCDPATLARDLAILAAGRFSVKKAEPFDMFPQTTHVETVVQLIYHRTDD